MVVDDVIFEDKVFEDELMVRFYGGGESFTNMVKSYDGRYIEKCRCEHSTRKLECIGRALPKENRNEYHGWVIHMVSFRYLNHI